MRRIGILLFACSLLAIGVGRAAAQEATPDSTTGTVACTVEPRPIDEMLGTWFSPEGTPVATPEPEPPVTSEAELPQGDPVDPEIEDAINATLQEIFACFDDGDYGRAFALFTDDYLLQFGPEMGTTLEQTRDFLEASPVPVPDEQRIEIGRMRDARMLPDGRVGAILDAPGGSVFFLFEEHEGRWLLDGIIAIFAAPDIATPTG